MGFKDIRDFGKRSRLHCNGLKVIFFFSVYDCRHCENNSVFSAWIGFFLKSTRTIVSEDVFTSPTSVGCHYSVVCLSIWLSGCLNCFAVVGLPASSGDIRVPRNGL